MEWTEIKIHEMPQKRIPIHNRYKRRYKTTMEILTFHNISDKNRI